MAVQVGIEIGVQGEREYRTALSNINAKTKELKSEMDLLTSSFDKNASSEAKAAATAEVMRREIANQESKVRTLTGQYNRQYTELRRLGQELEAAKSEYGENSEQAQKAEAAYQRYETTVSKTHAELNKAQTELNKMNQELAETEKAAKGADGSLATMPSVMEQIRSGAEATAAALDKVASGLETAAQKTAAISGAAAAVLGGSAVLASNFEDALAKVSTIADDSVMSIEDMSEAITNLSDETGIASTELAEAVYNAISAGQDTADAVNFVSNATRLARAGFTETGSALDVLTTIMNAYGLAADEVTDVSDILIQTQNLGKTTVNELASAMGKVIPTAASFGVELDQLGAAYAVITSNGVRTAEATTYMNALFNELGKSSTELAKTLDSKTGKSFAELMDEGNSVADVLAILQEAADEQGVAFNDLFSSSEAAKAGLILLGDSADDFNETLAKMNSATGSTEKAFEKLDTTSYSIQKTINLLKNTGIDLGKTFLEVAKPSLEAFANVVKQVREAVGKMDDAQKRQIVNIGLFVAALSPTLSLLAKVTSAVSGVAKAISAMIANPVIAGIAAAAVAIGAIALAIHHANVEYEAEVEAAGRALAANSAYTESEVRLMEATNERVEAMAASRAATEEASAALGFQRDRALDLLEQLKLLADDEGIVAEAERNHAQIIIDELNKAYGLEIEMIDGQIQAWDSLESAVYDVINAKTAEALLDRNRDDYLDALEAEAELLRSIKTAHSNAAEAEEEYYQYSTWAANATSYLQQHQLEMTRAEIDAYMERIDKLEEAANVAHENWMQSQADEAAFSQQYLANSRLITQYDAAQVAAQEGDTNRVIDLMLGRENAWNDYGETVSAVTASNLDALYNEAAEAGRYAAMLRENWENGVEGYTEEMVTEAETAYANMVGAFSEAASDAGAIGSDFILGLVNGLQAQEDYLGSEAWRIANNVPHGFRTVFDENSPSKVAAQIGDYFTLGLIRGLDRHEDELIATADNQADGVISAYSGFNDLMGGSVSVAMGGASSNSVNYGGVSITVNANEEQTAQEIAEAVMEQLQFAVERKGAVYA